MTCISLVIPAKAGIHGWARSGESRKKGAGGAMDPRFRGDDERGAGIIANRTVRAITLRQKTLPHQGGGL